MASDLIESIKTSRKITAELLRRSLVDLIGKSETEIQDKILHEAAREENIYPRGWYDPPPGGTGILFTEHPYTRLQYDSLRKNEFWPKEDSVFKEESVGMVYFSSVDKSTGMIGDIGLSIYLGRDQKIKQHILETYRIIRAVAKHAEAGMEFSYLYKYAQDFFKENNKSIKWMTTSNDPNLGMNLGHTVPGSFAGDNLYFNSDFDDTKNKITKKRIYINEIESFKIPPTCAFTVEARLVDLEKKLPNIFFHFIVTFNNGEKEILENFDEIFRDLGMDFMLKKY